MSEPGNSENKRRALPSRKDALERNVQINRLFDVYGELLTERQREFMAMHYREDLSFAEIANGISVTRQAVHDAVKHATTALEKFEERLGLLKASETGGAVQDAVLRIRRLRDRIRQSGGVIYDSTPIAEELDEIAALFEQNAPASSAVGEED